MFHTKITEESSFGWCGGNIMDRLLRWAVWRCISRPPNHSRHKEQQRWREESFIYLSFSYDLLTIFNETSFCFCYSWSSFSSNLLFSGYASHSFNSIQSKYYVFPPENCCLYCFSNVSPRILFVLVDHYHLMTMATTTSTTTMSIIRKIEWMNEWWLKDTSWNSEAEYSGGGESLRRRWKALTCD